MITLYVIVLAYICGIALASLWFVDPRCKQGPRAKTIYSALWLFCVFYHILVWIYGVFYALYCALILNMSAADRRTAIQYKKTKRAFDKIKEVPLKKQEVEDDG